MFIYIFVQVGVLKDEVMLDTKKLGNKPIGHICHVYFPLEYRCCSRFQQDV